jgi:hypothetical protein
LANGGIFNLFDAPGADTYNADERYVHGACDMAKLTLSADPKIISRAKKIARRRGTSVSGLFSRYIRSMDDPTPPPSLAPRTRQASGLIRLPSGRSDRQLMEDALSERFNP